MAWSKMDIEKENVQCVSFVYDKEKILQLKIRAAASGKSLSDVLRTIADRALANSL